MPLKAVERRISSSSALSEHQTYTNIRIYRYIDDTISIRDMSREHIDRFGATQSLCPRVFSAYRGAASAPPFSLGFLQCRPQGWFPRRRGRDRARACDGCPGGGSGGMGRVD